MAASEQEVLTFLGAQGPLIDVFLACRRGAIGPAVARAAVAERGVLDSVTVDELRRVSDRCVRWGYQSHWEDAMLLHGLLISCFMADRARFIPVVVILAREHLRVAATALWNRPDHAVYALARRIGESAWGAVKDLGNGQTIAFEMGILHLDPYVSTRTPFEFKHWWALAEGSKPADETVERMPEPIEALDLSREWLIRSLEGAEGVERLQTLKALVQGALSRPIVDAPADEDLARSLLPEALELAVRETHRSDIATYLQRAAEALGMPVPGGVSAIHANVDTNWEERIGWQGIDLVSADIVALMRVRKHEERAQGIAFARSVAAIFEERSSEAHRLTFHREVIRLLLGPPRKRPWLDSSIESTLGKIRAGTCGDEKRERAIEEVLGWVSGLLGREKEKDASNLLVELAKAAPELDEQAPGTLAVLKAQLDMGAGVNCVRAGDAEGAVTHYYSAWALLHRARYYRLGLELLARIADVLPDAGDTSAIAICELVREEGTPWVEGIDQAWHEALANLVAAATVPLEKNVTADGWFALCRLAKGSAYADQLLSSVVFDWRSDPQAESMLQWIGEREAALPAAAPATLDEYLFEHLLVSHRVEQDDALGSKVAEQRDNLARRLDLHVRSRLTAGAAQAKQRFDARAVQAGLPADTVLVDLLFPREGASFGYCLLISRDSMMLSRVHFETLAFKEVVLDGHVVSRVASTVVSVRRAVQGEPPPGDMAASNARVTLAGATREFLGHGVEWLAKAHAAGKRHLLVVPDGAMHFLPFHLLGEDKPFADDWIVTYLPSADLLRRPAAPARPEGAAVFGLRYAGTRDELAGAAAEAEAVAQALGVTATSEAEATPARVLDALSQKRYVHIACHGEHDVVASTLQSLRLTPGPQDDGRLRTLDIVGRDLRGLSLLALSACETGLGRVDDGGNPLGLGASALACGAGTVVTTLWPAHDDASATFFSTLFRELAAGRSRRDAFRTAQVATRAEFPEYRDWGAFCLSGQW
jgi:hypothetical protein